MTSRELEKRQQHNLKTYAITTWGACLEVLKIHRLGCEVKAPGTIDAGEGISWAEVIFIAIPK